MQNSIYSQQTLTNKDSMNSLFSPFARLLFVGSVLFMQNNVYSQTTAAPVKTIAALDVPRYLGTWYEIAKFPNWFQKKCVGNTKAVYSLKADGNLRVLNSCKKASGEITEAEGVARQLGAKDSPKLEVRFAPEWLSFLPIVWGDYWVIDLDPQYQVAVVSDPSRNYLWILSRTPQIAPQVYEEVLQRLQQQEFDIRQLEKTPQ